MTSPTPREAVRGALAVFRRIRSERDALDRIAPKPPAFGGGTLCLLVLRHSERVRRALAQAADGFAAVPGAQAYDEKLVHTTLADTAPRPLWAEPFDPAPFERGLAALARASALSAIRVRLGTPTFTRDAALAPGVPNEAFFEAARIVADAAGAGADYRAPWGAHVTLARFLAAGGPESVALAKKACDGEALGVVSPESVELWQCENGPSGFRRTRVVAALRVPKT